MTTNASANSALTPFRLNIPEAALADLRERLARTRWPEPLPGAAWQRGLPVDYVRDLADYWRTGYDWRAAEGRINSYPQYTTEIDGQNIHFLHVPSADPQAVPLLLLHGWPGSVAELLDLADALAKGPVPFELVIPSLPGFGLSGPTHAEGWDSPHAARALAELMRRLGHERYLVHGGDAGAVIARHLGILDPDHVAGIHVLELFSFPSGDPEEMQRLTPEDYRRLSVLTTFQGRAGYVAIHQTRPQTLAFALNDSPAGVLAWNLELMTGFGEHDVLSRDAILNNVMLYWLTGTSGSSANWYYEDAHPAEPAPAPASAPAPNPVPTGVAVFEHDFLSIRAFAERDNPRIVHWSEFQEAGHFAALEVPELLAEDIHAFARTVLPETAA